MATNLFIMVHAILILGHFLCLFECELSKRTVSVKWLANQKFKIRTVTVLEIDFMNPNPSIINACCEAVLNSLITYYDCSKTPLKMFCTVMMFMYNIVL